MTTAREDGRTAAERVEDLPRIQRALGKAVQEALAQHKRAGNPIVIWRDGAVTWVPADDILIEEVEVG